MGEIGGGHRTVASPGGGETFLNDDSGARDLPSLAPPYGTTLLV